MTPDYSTISPFLVSSKSKWSRSLGYIGLCLGVILLLCSVQMYMNVQQFIGGKEIKKSGYDFVSVSKLITDQNMGKDNRFTAEEIHGIQTQPFITDAAPLISNEFRAQISAGNIIPFSTDLFLEAIQDDFIDSVPPSFHWQPGESHVPVILSADYLEMYNIFAPSQDLPQLSESSIGKVQLQLDCSGMYGSGKYTAGIVGLSSRISTILVPQSFLEWANQMYGGKKTERAARVYLKTENISNPELVNFLQEKGYFVNKERTRSARIKVILQSFVSGLGIFSVIVILLSMMLFAFYLQLMIARSKDNLKLLQTLGYSPAWLSKMMAKRWIPVYTVIIIVALGMTVVLQYAFSLAFSYKETLSAFIAWPVIAIAGLLLLLCIWINSRLISRELNRL